MSDQEEPGRGSVPGDGGYRVDAVERLRRKLEGLRAAEAGGPAAGEGSSKVTRLPRRPRRMTEEASERPQQPWRSEGGSVYDPAPTRPVQRSELQRETGWWPADPGRAQHPAPETEPGGGEQDGGVVDLGAARRKRTADGGPVGGIRRVARPRRIGSSASEGTGGEQGGGRGGDAESPRPDGPN
ncbi:hypothetical protein [Nocardia sp. NPDC127526]|uniref:hypothetical protein n=1 Tax=Nocardia sp. NPDC127526 TaxID=3345393 RepID=UPI00362D018D